MSSRSSISNGFYFAPSLLRLKLFLCLILSCEALQSFVTRIPNGDKVVGPTGEPWNGVGHIRPNGGGERNQFGKDFASAGYKWTADLCQKDSDCDGRTNGQELGDPHCTWEEGKTPEVQDGITHPGVVDTPATTSSIVSKPKADLCSNFDQSKLPATAKNYTFTMSEYQVPSKETHYARQKIVFEPPGGEDMYALWLHPIIENPEVVHHMFLYHCQFDPTEVLKAAREFEMPCPTPVFR